MTDRIDFHSSAEALFQDFRRWALSEGIKVPTLPVYDFGQLLDTKSDVFIGAEPFLAGAEAFYGQSHANGFQLPHPECGFITRYGARDGSPDYLFMIIGAEALRQTDLGFFMWDRRRGWWQTAYAKIDGELEFKSFEKNLTPDEYALRRNSYMTGLSCGMYMIFERGGAVEANPMPPQITKGRTKVHPLAPSRVVVISIDRPRLLRTLYPEPATGTGTKKAGHMRAASTPHYNHPRFRNVRGTVGKRAGGPVNGGGPAKTYTMVRGV